jgi:membrane protein
MESIKAPRGASAISDLGIVMAYACLNAILPKEIVEKPTDDAFGNPVSRREPQRLQEIRAAETGRGRDARSPGAIPLRGWKDVVWRTYAQVQEDRLLAIAAGVVFHGVLALFPAVTALVSLYGLFAQSSTIHDHLAFLSTFLPSAAITIVDDQIARIVSKGDAKLSVGFLVGLGIVLWSANAGIKAMIDALNIVYEEKEKRSFFKLNLVSLAFTMGAVAALLLAIGAVVALPLMLDKLTLGTFASSLVTASRWPALCLGLLLGLALLYRYAPSRKAPKWQWISLGSVLACALWIGGSAAFSYYLENYAHYDATYGSLGTGIGLMMWMWMTIIVILLGAELNSEIEHQTAVDTTEGPAKPLGSRGAAMADTVGAAQS